MFNLKDIVDAGFDINSASQNNSHKTHTTQKHFIKFNKGGEARISLIEFYAHKIIRSIVGPEHIPDIDLVIDECEETGARHIVGVAVNKLEGFTEFTDINIINLIAEIESKERGDNQYKAMTLMEELYDSRQDERIGISRQYFDGKAERRIEFFNKFIKLLFIRYLLKEDDGHKGNCGIVDTNGELVFFMLDFDNLIKTISADLDIVRLSQYGSPHDKFQLSCEDFERFPLIKDSKPGHFVGIESNTLEAQSISPNPGRITYKDKAALTYLLSLPEFSLARDKAVYEALRQFIDFDINVIMEPLRGYSGERLKSCYQVELVGDEAINFAAVFEQELAVTQVEVCKLIQEVGAGTTPLGDFLKDGGVVSQAKRKGEPWYTGAALNNKIDALKAQFEEYPGKDLVGDFIQCVEDLDANKLYHTDLALLKSRTVELAQVVVEQCDSKQLLQFVNWRNDLPPNYIIQARKAGFWSRKFKNHLFNTMTSTNVSLRDLAKKRALVLRAQGVEMAYTINLLIERDSLLDSHSLRPLTFSERFQYRFIPLFLANFSSKPLWENYLDEKMDFERYTPFIIVCMAKDIIKFTHEFVLFLLEYGAYKSRRFFSDQVRSTQSKIGLPWKLFCSVGAVLSLVVHYAVKVMVRVLRLLTSPFMSAEKLKTVFQNAARMFGMKESNIYAAGKVGYIVSLMLSSAMIVVAAKFLAIGLLAVSCAKTALVLSNAFGLFSIWVGSLLSLYLLHPDGSDQPHIEHPNRLIDKFILPVGQANKHAISPVRGEEGADVRDSLLPTRRHITIFREPHTDGAAGGSVSPSRAEDVGDLSSDAGSADDEEYFECTPVAASSSK